MGEAVVSMALGTLRDLLLDESKLLLGVSGQVKELQKLFKEIQCLLEDADRRQHESISVANWISEIRDLAYRAEDVIETYASRVSSNRRRRLLSRYSHVLGGAFSLHQIGSEISEIKSEIARVSKNMQDYGIRGIIQGESSSAVVDLAAENRHWKRRTSPNEIEDCFVGKDEELKHLASLVHDTKHRVVSVWGMGGIGKTTIAIKVYNCDDTKRFFKSFAWVCITQQCRIRSVLEDVLRQLSSHKIDDVSSLTDTELMEQLMEIQKAKKCMIVLDDVWEIDHWEGLKQAFLVQGLNTKILVTTRKLKVANKVGFAFQLGLLNAQDGWELLKNKAFPHASIPDFSIEEKLLQEIGEQIVHKCGYLPLVISLIGGVLRDKKSTKEWKKVNSDINVYLHKGGGVDDDNEIYEVLNLSYDDLPYYLKPCFLYMGQFREDETINVYTLYRLWISQGMISHKNQENNETLMDIAQIYLNELASRSMVQVQDYISEENYRLCRLHDVVRQLCLSRGKKEDFCQVMDYQGGKFSTLLHELLLDMKTRHLAIYFHKEPDAQPDHGECKATYEETGQHLRSLQFRNQHVERIEFPESTVDLQSFKVLRVLSFDRFKFAGRKFPRGISSLIHLRYLYLRKCELDELPSSISKLAYLHTLDLSNSWNVRVPSIMKKMCRLKHLLLPSYDKEKIGDYRLRLEGLEELETLYGFNSLVHDLKSFTGMKNLRRLAAVVHDNEILSEILNAIALNWKNLFSCGLIIKHGCQLTSSKDEGLTILRKVFECPNLHDLGINVRIGELLKDCRDQILVSRIVTLYLFECEVEDDPMEILGKLPVLEELCLNERSFMGQEMKCDALDFPCLRSLSLRGLPNLRDWRVEDGAMPRLSELEIDHCSCLEMVPDGFRFISTLRILKVSGMPKLGKRVLDGQEDFEKVCHVPSLVIVGD